MEIQYLLTFLRVQKQLQTTEFLKDYDVFKGRDSILFSEVFPATTDPSPYEQLTNVLNDE